MLGFLALALVRIVMEVIAGGGLVLMLRRGSGLGQGGEGGRSGSLRLSLIRDASPNSERQSQDAELDRFHGFSARPDPGCLSSSVCAAACISHPLRRVLTSAASLYPWDSRGINTAIPIQLLLPAACEITCRHLLHKGVSLMGWVVSPVSPARRAVMHFGQELDARLQER